MICSGYIHSTKMPSNKARDFQRQKSNTSGQSTATQLTNLSSDSGHRVYPGTAVVNRPARSVSETQEHTECSQPKRKRPSVSFNSEPDDNSSDKSVFNTYINPTAKSNQSAPERAKCKPRARRYTEGSVERFEDYRQTNVGACMHHSETYPKALAHCSQCMCPDCVLDRRTREVEEVLNENESCFYNRSGRAPSLHSLPDHQVHRIRTDTSIALDRHGRPFVTAMPAPHTRRRAQSDNFLDTIESGDAEVTPNSSANHTYVSIPMTRPAPSPPVCPDIENNSSSKSSTHVGCSTFINKKLILLFLVMNVLLFLAVAGGVPIYLYMYNTRPPPDASPLTSPRPGDCIECDLVKSTTYTDPVKFGLERHPNNSSMCCVPADRSVLHAFLGIVESLSSVKKGKEDQNFDTFQRPVLQVRSISRGEPGRPIAWLESAGGDVIKAMMTVERSTEIHVLHTGYYLIITRLMFESAPSGNGSAVEAGHSVHLDHHPIQTVSQKYFPPNNSSVVEYTSSHQFLYHLQERQVITVISTGLSYTNASILVVYIGTS